MAQPTPWGSSDASPGRPDPSNQVSPTSGRFALRVQADTLRQSWGSWCAVVAGIITLLLLFQPWANASGPDGRASTNAFGKIHASTAYLSAWSQQHSAMAKINGIWAILAAAAIVVMCLLAVVNMRVRTEMAARCMAICAVSVALLVLITLVYINAKAPELKAMTARKYDMGGQIGSLMAWAFGNGSLVIPGMKSSSYSSAALTPWGMVACALSVTAAVAAVAQWMRDYPGRIRLRLRSPIVSASSSASAPAESQPADPPSPSSDRPSAEA